METTDGLPSSVFNRPFILRGIRAGKVHISLLCAGDRLVVGKGLIIIEGQGFDQRSWNPFEHLHNGRFGGICLLAGNLFQADLKGCPIGDDKQGRLVSFAYHEVNFQIAKARALLDNLRAMFDTHTIAHNPPGVVVIATFAPSSAML